MPVIDMGNGKPLNYGTIGSIPAPTTARPAMTLLGRDITPWVQLTRIEKYGGVLLLFWPFGGGCIWNDILDRDIDRYVERTKNRPLASGKVSVFGALIFLFFHVVALVAMLIPLNAVARRIGFFAIFVFPGLYPLMKRITYWPQAWLGLTFNIGIPFTWAAITGSCPKSAFLFYAGAWSWSIWYDTIYACQDKKDDVNIGIKSTAVLFDSYVKQILACFGVMTMGCFAATGYLINAHWTFFAISIFGGSLHFYWQLTTVNLDSSKSCWGMFTANAYSFGFVIWVGILVQYVCIAFYR